AVSAYLPGWSPAPPGDSGSRMWAIPPARATRSNKATATHEPSRVRSLVGAAATAQRPIATEIVASSFGGDGGTAVPHLSGVSGVQGGRQLLERRGVRDEQQGPAERRRLGEEAGLDQEHEVGARRLVEQGELDQARGELVAERGRAGHDRLG